MGDFPGDPMGLSRNKHNRNLPDQTNGTRRQTRNTNPRLRVTQFQKEGGRAIMGDFPGDPMGLSRNKHNRNFPDRTKPQDGRVVTLTLDLGLRHFKGKAVELLLEISQAIPWD